MARKPVVLVTGAGGEIGHGLITRLAELGTFDILALDMRPVAPELSRRCTAAPREEGSSNSIYLVPRVGGHLMNGTSRQGVPGRAGVHEIWRERGGSKT